MVTVPASLVTGAPRPETVVSDTVSTVYSQYIYHEAPKLQYPEYGTVARVEKRTFLLCLSLRLLVLVSVALVILGCGGARVGPAPASEPPPLTYSTLHTPTPQYTLAAFRATVLPQRRRYSTLP